MSDAPEQFAHEASEVIRRIAMSLPHADEGSSCVNRAFSSGGKNFAFLGEADGECALRLKLGDSIEHVIALDAERAGSYEVGKFGWTMLRFPAESPPAVDELETWITESFRLLAPKKMQALLAE